MENSKRIAAEDDEILLPEAIIQHIQSFLNGKQSAQTSVLSKAWYSAWSTRPNLVFDQSDFTGRGDGGQNADEFSEFTRKAMQRYQELDLRVESFRLWMKVDEGNIPLARELIVKAVQLGATDLDLEFLIQTDEQFVLPLEMIASENLIRLSVTGCTIIHGLNQEVKCSKLKSFSLSRVYIRSDTIHDIISSCPLIETFSLCDCECLLKFNRFLTGVFHDNRRSRFFIDLGRQNLCGPINLNEFHKLKCLYLRDVNIDTFFFRDFSSKFPCLKDLTLWGCMGNKSVRFSSRSLECISIVQDGRLMAKFNVPSIRKFKFSGSCLPSLSFKTASREWESDISLPYIYPTASWFLKFKKFLKKLTLSTMSLSIRFAVPLMNSYDIAGDTQGLPGTVVENLTLRTYDPLLDCSAFLGALLLSCRPNFITEYWPHNRYMKKRADIDFLDVLFKTLIQEVTEDCCIPNQNMSGLHELEEVKVESFEESLAEWQLVPLKTLSDASAFSEIKQKIRFRLRWGLPPITSN